jgi:hypothetical protein
MEIKMKKYLLLIEDERMWGKFKESIEGDINTEIINLIKDKIKKSSSLAKSSKENEKEVKNE